MAKNANELNRKVLQNLRTSGSNEYIINKPLSDIVADGEIIVQMGSGATVEDAKKTTGLWTLAADGSTPVRFPSEERVSEMISSGAVAEVDAIEEAVGLSSAGTYVDKSGTNYLDSAETVEGEIGILDTQLGALSGYVGNLDANSVADDNKVVSDVTQNDGLITATAKNITEVKLAGYAEGSDAKVANTDTLGEALGKLQGQINAMDKVADAETGHIVTTVSEADGKVSETKALLKDIVLSGYTKSNSTGAIEDDDTLNEALSKLENKVSANKITNEDGSIIVTEPTGTATTTDVKVQIKSGEKVLAKDGNAGLYTDLDLVKITTGLPETVKERYQLLATDDTQLGVNIDIYKDSHIVSIEYIESSQTLEYKYIDASGVTQTTDIDLSELVLEAEFASGVTVTNHIVHGVVDETSEGFLTVGADGFKLSGVQNAINAAVNALNADVSGKSVDNHVQVEVVEVSGVVTTVNVTTDDIASSAAVTTLSGAVEDEIARAKSAEAALDGVIGSEKGASDESRTYGHSGTQYLNNNTTVKADVETLDKLLSAYTQTVSGQSYDVTFSQENSVAKNISDIKAKLDDYKQKLTLNAVDDDKYIATEVATAATGTTIGVSAITKTISTSTSSDSALADSYDVRHFAVNNIVADTTKIKIIEDTAEGNTDAVRKIDFSQISIDCGEF